MTNVTDPENWCLRGDPFCPCQDGDPCHYEDDGGTKAMPSPAAWLTTAQVAALHGVQPPTVAKWCRLGLLPGWKPGKEWLVQLTDATDFTPPDPRGGWTKGKPRIHRQT